MRAAVPAVEQAADDREAESQLVVGRLARQIKHRRGHHQAERQFHYRAGSPEHRREAVNIRHEVGVQMHDRIADCLRIGARPGDTPAGEADGQQNRAAGEAALQDPPAPLRDQHQWNQDEEVELDRAQSENHAGEKVPVLPHQDHRDGRKHQDYCRVLPILQACEQGDGQTGERRKRSAFGHEQHQEHEEAEQAERLKRVIGGAVGKQGQWMQQAGVKRQARMVRHGVRPDANDFALNSVHGASRVEVRRAGQTPAGIKLHEIIAAQNQPLGDVARLHQQYDQVHRHAGDRE